MTILAIIILIILGIALLLVEILMLPGIVVGVIGVGLTITGIVMAYTNFGMSAGNLTLFGTFVSTLVSLYFALKSKTWDKVALKSSIDSKVNTIKEDTVKVGDEGITITRLATIGRVLVNDMTFDAESPNKFIDPQTQIIVTKIMNGKLIVKPKKN